MSSQDELLALATGVAHEAGAELRTAFGRLGELEISAKSTPTDLVSEADVATERLIRARLEAARPDDAILGEEGDDRAGTSGLRWVVDPLDGTVELPVRDPAVVREHRRARTRAARSPASCTTRCATRPGPRRATATPRSTARPLRPPARGGLATALVATGFGYDAGVRAQQAAIVARLLPRVRDVRRLGAAALDLAWVAAGRYDGYFERGVKHWDVAAGALICARAGPRRARAAARAAGRRRAARRGARHRRRAARARDRLIGMPPG